MEALTETINKLSSRVHEAEQQGSPVEELGDLLANLDVTQGEPADEAAIQAFRFGQKWRIGTISKSCMREDTVEEGTTQLNGTAVDGGGGRGLAMRRRPTVMRAQGARGAAPPAYAELSSHFGVLERAAGGNGNGEAVFYLTKARMVMIAAHASK